MARKVSIVVFSDDLDKACAAFNIANGAAASGLEVTMFFTCWGVNILKKKGSLLRGDNIVSKLMNFLTRGGASRLGLSKFNFLGLGSWLMRQQMTIKNIQSIPEMMADAKELGVDFFVCDNPMDIFGLKEEDLIDEVKGILGVASYINKTLGSEIALFI